VECRDAAADANERGPLVERTLEVEMKHAWSRRTAAIALTLLATGFAAPGRAQDATGPKAVAAAGTNELGLEVVRLSPRVAVVYGDPWDNGIVAIATKKGIVVVDAPFSKTIGAAFREAIRAELKRSDFAWLVNTHEHVCHIGGNAAFADVPIVGHESLRDEVLSLTADPGRVPKLCEMADRQVARVRDYFTKRDPKKLESADWAVFERSWKTIQADARANPALVPPTITFERQMTLHLDDVSVRLDFYGRAHGVADTIVRVPEENLVLTAGVFYPTKVPTVDAVAEKATPAGIDNWFVVMRAVLSEANGETRFLPSHGRAVMKKSQYEDYVSYLEGVWNGVKRARSAGRTLEQAKAELPLKSFPAVAKLPNEDLRGTEWENLDIHGHNIERLWKVLDRPA
jgi:glyoxylase-like metal-dependent hydrolase (beta-lactamase superfamily II)